MFRTNRFLTRRKNLRRTVAPVPPLRPARAPLTAQVLVVVLLVLAVALVLVGLGRVLV